MIKIIFWNKCYDQWTLSEQCILIKLTNCAFVGCELNYLHTCFTQSSYVLGCCSYLLFSLVSFCAMLLPIVIVVMQFLINYHTMNLYLNKCVQCMHSVYSTCNNEYAFSVHVIMRQLLFRSIYLFMYILPVCTLAFFIYCILINGDIIFYFVNWTRDLIDLTRSLPLDCYQYTQLSCFAGRRDLLNQRQFVCSMKWRIRVPTQAANKCRNTKEISMNILHL